MDEKYENRSEETKGAHVDQIQGKAVVTGFHSETSESEVIQLLKESITEIGMTIENARTECPAKPITHAFLHFKNDEERNKLIRSCKKKFRGRKIKITRSMDAEERFHNKRMGYVKYCPTRIKFYELDNEICFNQRSDCCGDSTKWKPEIYQIPRRRSRSRRTNAKMAVKKLIATTVSSREKGTKRREEGWTMSGEKTTTTQRNHSNERCTNEGGGRDKLKKVDGDIPTRWKT